MGLVEKALTMHFRAVELKEPELKTVANTEPELKKSKPAKVSSLKWAMDITEKLIYGHNRKGIKAPKSILPKRTMEILWGKQAAKGTQLLEKAVNVERFVDVAAVRTLHIILPLMIWMLLLGAWMLAWILTPSQAIGPSSPVDAINKLAPSKVCL